MRRILDTFRDADGLQVTATMAAYMIEHGVDRYMEAQATGTYEAWKAARWDDFAVEHGLTALTRHHHREAFLDWLDQRAVDHIARNKVEAG